MQKNPADYGAVTIWLKDNAGNVIATGSQSNLDAANYTKVTVPLSYVENPVKPRRFMSNLCQAAILIGIQGIKTGSKYPLSVTCPTGNSRVQACLSTTSFLTIKLSDEKKEYENQDIVTNSSFDGFGRRDPGL